MKLKMKKIMSVICAITFLFNSYCLVSFANVESDVDFSIEDYTFDDLKSMSIEEKIELLHNYEITYMPEMFCNSALSFLPNLAWDSGNNYFGESHEFRTHELVTLEAIVELENFLNQYENGASVLFGDSTQALAISLSLAISSALPDRVGNGSVVTLFAGHFYNPETGKNFLGFKSPTAKTNAVTYYNNSMNNLISNCSLANNNSNGIEYVGWLLHFVQDANEPHHSSNVISNPLNDSHGDFEEYAFININSIINCSINHTSAVMQAYSSLSIEEIIDLSATISHSYIDTVNDTNDRTQWYNTANVCIDSATSMSAIVMYKVFKAKGII